MASAPVRVIDVATENWNPEQATLKVTDQPVPIAGRDPMRRKVTIINDADSVGTVWVVPGHAQRRIGGFPLRPNSSHTLTTKAAVSAYSTLGDATVYVVTEQGGV